jgi:hypothetical protein
MLCLAYLRRRGRLQQNLDSGPLSSETVLLGALTGTGKLNMHAMPLTAIELTAIDTLMRRRASRDDCHRGRARCAVKTSNLNVPQLPYEIWEKILYEVAHRACACHPQSNREPMIENACSCEGCMQVDTFAGDYLWALFQI